MVSDTHETEENWICKDELYDFFHEQNPYCGEAIVELEFGNHIGLSEQVSKVLFFGATVCLYDYKDSVPFEQSYRALVAADMIDNFKTKGCYDIESSSRAMAFHVENQFCYKEFPNSKTINLASLDNGDFVSVGYIHIDKECFEKIIILGVLAVLREDLNDSYNFQTTLTDYSIYKILKGNTLDEAMPLAFKKIRCISHRMLANTLNSIETW